MLAAAKPKIVLLDDDPAFLAAAVFYLEKKLGNTAIIKPFDASSCFIEYLENHCYLPESPQEIIRSFYSGDKTQEQVKQTLIDLAELPAIVIIDHQLRNEAITGIELSQQIREYLPCLFIILLTAQVDEKTALELHNHEIIDCYVQKSQSKPMDLIYDKITQQIKKFEAYAYINPEDAFGFNTILESDHYLSKRQTLLDQLSYQAYLTVSERGEIAVLDHQQQIDIYHFHDKAC